VILFRNTARIILSPPTSATLRRSLSPVVRYLCSIPPCLTGNIRQPPRPRRAYRSWRRMRKRRTRTKKDWPVGASPGGLWHRITSRPEGEKQEKKDEKGSKGRRKSERPKRPIPRIFPRPRPAPQNGPPSSQSIRVFALPPGGLTLNSLARMKKVAEVVRAVHRLIAVLM